MKNGQHNSTTTEPHPNLETLSDFAMGKLNEPQITALESHLIHCEMCCRRLEKIPEDRFVSLARNAASMTRSYESDTSPTPLTATTFELQNLERYRVLERIGRGGMGDVYRAEHKLMDREVALKVIHPQLIQSPEAVSRFRNEVRAAAKLNHPNIVASYDAENVGELNFLVMELVNGESLNEIVKREGPQSVENALALVRQVAAGLQEAKKHGMVHRDIKPHNLMLDQKGTVKILDFGLAKFEREVFHAPVSGISNPGVTGTHFAIGTPDYIAPEQAKDAATVDSRSDIYSLGCTLYFLLAGQPPYPDGEPVEKISQHLVSQPVPIQQLRPEVPEEVAKLLARMIARDPLARFQTPSQLMQAIDDLNQPGAKTRRSRLSRRSLIASAVGIAALATGTFVIPKLLKARSALFVAPNRLYYPDLFSVERILSSKGFEVSIAAQHKQIEPVIEEQGNPFKADLLISEVQAQNYDVIIFVGGHIQTLLDEPDRSNNIRKMIEEQVSNGKLVASMCVGAQVPEQLGFEQQMHAGQLVNSILVSPPFITASDPELAQPFCDAIIKQLDSLP